MIRSMAPIRPRFFRRWIICWVASPALPPSMARESSRSRVSETTATGARRSEPDSRSRPTRCQPGGRRSHRRERVWERVRRPMPYPARHGEVGILLERALSAKIATRHSRPRIANGACNDCDIKLPYFSASTSMKMQPHRAQWPNGQLAESGKGAPAPTIPGAELASRRRVFITIPSAVTLKAVSVGTEINIVQKGIPDAIPAEACYLDWPESLRHLARLVEPEIKQ